jgi:hypothetical protein
MQKWGGGHEGATAGFSSAFVFDTDQRRAMVVLANRDDSQIIAKLERLLRNQSPKPPRTAEINCALYDTYAGQYRSEDRSVVTVRREGTRLLLSMVERSQRYRRAPSYEIFPQSDTLFYNQLFEFQAAFVPDAQGKAMRLKLLYSEKQAEWEGEKISDIFPATPDSIKLAPDVYDQYAGQYRLALGPLHIGPVISFSHESDSLGDHLIVSSPALRGPYLGGTEVFPVAEGTFVLPSVNAEVRFARNKKGKITCVTGCVGDSEARLSFLRPFH